MPVLPYPFAVITVDGEHRHATSVINKTAKPHWSESFDLCVSHVLPLDCILD
jgi:hypothetical protein